MKILVVDDDEINLNIADFILKKAGYDVMTARSGKECLESVRAGSFDLILLDIFMPETDGFETCKMLKNEPLYNGAPIAFLTASEDKENVEKAVELSGNECIFKPFKADILTGGVKRILGK
ncbi:MAG: response regulator [Oscillospiraceae bacterium]|nr:response regulator [Oscillospiraceae bacterium]